jgi:hypothetical protein
MKNPIQLEPHSAFQVAIVKTDKKGFITYNYFKLIEVCMELHGWNDEDAQEWVDYNIVGLAINGFKISYAQPRR